jgi:hypothetical protein
MTGELRCSRVLPEDLKFVAEIHLRAFPESGLTWLGLEAVRWYCDGTRLGRRKDGWEVGGGRITVASRHAVRSDASIRKWRKSDLYCVEVEGSPVVERE